MLPAGFEPAVSASDWPQILHKDRSAREIGIKRIILQKYPLTELFSVGLYKLNSFKKQQETALACSYR
jgi:hypothetical protein